MSRRADLLAARTFFEGVVSSPAYRENFKLRAEMGALPPAVETRMLEYVFGKPTEVVVTDDDTDLRGLSLDELKSYLGELESQIAQLQGEPQTILH